MSENSSETADLLQMAMYREVASNAFYVAGQGKTEDPGAAALMKELAGEESEHYRRLAEYKEHGKISRAVQKVKDLMQTAYLTGGDSLEGAGLQDTLIFAIKREQDAVDFYTRLTGTMTTKTGKELCRKLATQELGHKMKLELLYESLFLKED